MKNAFVAFLFALVLHIGVAPGDDWPQFRGPNRDGVWNETAILDRFPAEGLKFAWRAPVEHGFSSPVVANGRVYVTDAKYAKSRADERVHCFDEKTGETLWNFAYDAAYPDWALTQADVEKSGPTATPIVDDGKLYTAGMNGDLHCLDAATGRVVWKLNLQTEFHVQEFSFNASPVIEGKLLILSIGSFPHPADSCVVALDKSSGKLVWKTPDDGVTNSSPSVIASGGKRQLIVWTTQSIISLDPATGADYWREPEKIAGYPCSPPILKGDRLLVGGIMLKLQDDKPAAATLWPVGKGSRGRVLSNTSSAVFEGDFVYSALTSGQFVCMEANTGKEIWNTDRVTNQQAGSSVHITPIGNRALLFTDEGNLILAQLMPQGYSEMSRAKLIDPTYRFGGRNRAWTPPAFANGHVFARSDKELVCASLAAQP